MERGNKGGRVPETVRLDIDTWQIVEADAKRAGMTLSGYLSDVVRQHALRVDLVASFKAETRQ